MTSQISTRKTSKRLFGRGGIQDALDAVILMLLNDEPLPQKRKDHSLVGCWKGHRELHIESDWLLIYKKPDSATLVLVRLGTHSELFE